MRLAAFGAALLGALAFASPAWAQDEVFAETETVALDPSDPSNVEFDQLIFKGGLEIAPGDEEIGGISGLEWYDDRLYAVTDNGRWLTILPDEIDGRLIDILTLEIGNLSDTRGRRLRRKEQADAEAITRIPDGSWLVAFEQDHRIWTYGTLDEASEGVAQGQDMDAITAILTGASSNGGIETLAIGGERLIACGEWSEPGKPNCINTHEHGVTTFELSAPSELAEHGGAPTDAACNSAGTCYVLFRSYRPNYGNRIAILELVPNGETRTLATFNPPLAIDNFEGLAVREQYGKTYLYMVSDNNFSDDQRTLLMKFEIKNEEPVVAVAPKPVVEYETQDVVLETSLGDMSILLETERAPVTSANFLRYVEENRFDGTVFYRAMKLDREPQPNGLIQGGTQFDPKRILPGIAHEPTTETGLSHTNGALSMAMGDPGTANGDFSIMLQDQIGLDARPEAEEAIWQNGYAVFGYVIDGMDVVSAIHALPADPSKGEGAMRGQILADPVTIVDARVIEETASE